MSDFHSTPSVEYRDIPGLPGYKVGDDGTVISCRIRGRTGGLTSRWLPLRQFLRQGYPAITLGRPKRNFQVHSLAAAAFLGPRPPGYQVCHNNGIKTDNRPSNLRYDSVMANLADNWRLGKGVIPANPQITDDDVIRLLAAGFSRREINVKFGLSYDRINGAMRRTAVLSAQ